MFKAFLLGYLNEIAILPTKSPLEIVFYIYLIFYFVNGCIQKSNMYTIINLLEVDSNSHVQV